MTKSTGIYPSDRVWEKNGNAPPRRGVLIGGAAARAKHLDYAGLFVTQVGGSMLALWWLFTQPTGWVEWSAFVIGYLVINFGLSVGFHRYFTHRAFETSQRMRYFIGICGQMACQGSVKKWAADHRRHHAFADDIGDLHSPQLDGHGRPMNKWKGFAISHFGWLFDNAHTDMTIYGKGLVGDPAVEFCHRTRWFWVAVSMVGFPAAWGYIFGGVDAIIGTVLIGGFLRTFIFLNGVMGTNSLAHMFGYQRFKDVGGATNNWFVNLIVLGDGWHNNHHRHPRSASNTIAWWEWDLNGKTIFAMERLGLVWNVQRRKVTDAVPVLGDHGDGQSVTPSVAEPHELGGAPVMFSNEKNHAKTAPAVV